MLVEATQPFANNDNVGMLRWLLGGRVGGEDRVREIIVSQDRNRAIVEFVNLDPGGMKTLHCVIGGLPIVKAMNFKLYLCQTLLLFIT